MVTAFASDQPGTSTLTTDAVVGQRHLQRRVDCLRAAIDEKRIADALRRDVDQAVRQFENSRVAQLKRHRIIECFRLLLDRLNNLRMAVTGVATPQSGDGVQQLFALSRVAVHALRTRNHARMLFEVPVARKWHPICLQIG